MSVLIALCVSTYWSCIPPIQKAKNELRSIGATKETWDILSQAEADCQDALRACINDVPKKMKK